MAAALVTGASSGIGREAALMLSDMGYDLVLVSRRGAALRETAKQAKTRVIIITADLSDREECKKLCQKTKGLDIEVLINNAGFGVFGEFAKTSLSEQLNMLDLNVGAAHMLMHVFLKRFLKRGRGYILNTASLAAFGPGPLLAAYYAGKAYLYSLSAAVSRETQNRGVNICVLCPGPVDTGFNNRAGVQFSLPPMSAEKVAKAGLKGLFAGKRTVVPGVVNKLTAAVMKFAPTDLVMSACYHIQRKKMM